MKIIADSKIPLVTEAFADIAEVATLDAQQITADTSREADALLVRSETKVDHTLLLDSRIRFVGTATIGTDHIDTGELQQQGIAFASAPGSNANSVAEYIVAALLVLAKRLGSGLEGKSLGIVGVGNIGSIVVKYAGALGMRVLLNDPPRSRASSDPMFRSLDELMECDVITVHVPLTKTGEDRTLHLFDEKRIRQMKPGSILINTSRGEVVDTDALRTILGTGHLAACVLDVWKNEPSIDVQLLSLSALGTPHIAGYSYDGKINGTVMLHKALCKHFGLQSAWKPKDNLYTGATNPILIPKNSSLQESLLAVIRGCYDIEADDRKLRSAIALPPADRAKHFRRMRMEYPLRREFQRHEVVVHKDDTSLISTMTELGFRKITIKNG